MTSLRVEVELRSPLVLRDGHGVGSVSAGLDYLPGSALRGALAATLLRDGLAPSERLFAEGLAAGGVRFGNLYPTSGDTIAKVIPATARSCKYSAGFASDGGHGVQDSLLHQLRDAPQADCPACRAPLAPFGGFFDEGGLVSVGRSFLTRTAIDNGFGTAAAGLLYTVQAVDRINPQTREPQRLAGLLDGDALVLDGGEPAQATFAGRPLIAAGQRLLVGAGRGRGQGELVIRGLGPAPPSAPVVERCAAFQAALGEEAPRTFSLTLQAEAIVQDRFLRYRSLLGPDDLIEAGRLPADSELALIRSFASSRRIAGWNAALGLPKPACLAIVKGSVFIFEVRGALPEGDLLAGLTGLEEGGLGERRAEGFGRLSVCDPFHLA